MWFHLWRATMLVVTLALLIVLLYTARLLRAIRFVLDGGCL